MFRIDFNEAVAREPANWSLEHPPKGVEVIDRTPLPLRIGE
jgi:hypothetical protein